MFYLSKQGIFDSKLCLKKITFKISIIPYTWKNTTFRNLKVGSVLNTEVDMLARYVFKGFKQMKNIFSPIKDIIHDLSKGKMVIIVDDENRENEGDLIFCAEHVDSEKINFMAKHARGLICLALDKKRVEKLNLKLMTETNQSNHRTAFTVSIDARSGITTGISAKDRAQTIKVATMKTLNRWIWLVPGHIFPLLASEGGVLVRAGHTEAAVDLSKLALGNKNPYGVICEIMNDDGTMARFNDLVKFCKKHKLKMSSIKDLIEYRLKKEKFVRCIKTDFFKFGKNKNFKNVHL